ncbi:hypothetical protein FACS1894107_02330 [Planctomycetales bacterium]|nr:hypothetical protein FACS1894107_02330 [Planctomycetales bacterium]GHT00004.1 hypothetical protein FACS1894108_11120 [Planctomycetales bacterium]
MKNLLFLALFALTFTAYADDEAAANPRDGENVENNFDWRVRTAFPATGVAAVDAQVSAFLKNFLAGQIAASGEVFAPYNATLTVVGKLTRPSSRAVSVVLLMDNYEQSAAHPSHLTRVLNYEASGAALPFNKIFGKPENALTIFARLAPDLALEQLKKIVADDGALAQPDAADLQEMLTGFQDGFAATAENYAAVGLEPTGVRLYFQEYQIAPYSFGMPTVLIPLADLADAEPNLALWGK